MHRPIHEVDRKTKAIVAAAILSMAAFAGPAVPAYAHSLWSPVACVKGSGTLDAYYQAGVNGHNSSGWGAFARTWAIANQGSVACGHDSEHPAVVLAARWKSYRQGAFCAQSSFFWTPAPLQSIAIGWQHPYWCGGSGQWTDRACAAIVGTTEKCDYRVQTSHYLP